MNWIRCATGWNACRVGESIEARATGRPKAGTNAVAYHVSRGDCARRPSHRSIFRGLKKPGNYQSQCWLTRMDYDCVAPANYPKETLVLQGP